MPTTFDHPHPFVVLAQGRDDEYPILARAVQDIVRANDVRIEWLVDTLVPQLGKWDPSMKTAIWHNYQQIFRAQKKSRKDLTVDDAAHEAAKKMLIEIERSLTDGVPYSDFNGSLPYSTMGGYKHYLGRPLNDNDILRLRPLREPFLRIVEQDEFQVYLDYPIAEWICETSLQVIPQSP